MDMNYGHITIKMYNKSFLMVALTFIITETNHANLEILIKDISYTNSQVDNMRNITSIIVRILNSPMVHIV